LIKYFYEPPYLIKKVFKEFQWNTINNEILLTFDDGPINETTDFILTELNKNKIKAVFFCVGNNIKNNPSLCESILSERHIIGNHTFNHKKISTLSEEDLKNELNSFNEILINQFNYEVKYFRPPHGKFNLKSIKKIKELKLKTVMWSLLTYDFRNDFNLFKNAVNKCLKKNSIIVLHDSLKSKDIIIQSINYLVEQIDKMNFKIGNPEECLK
jgi:peptidoglycan/xylan/chitin deacetylase (PgdA/CDA1 family)